jgi:hypothetical protein
MEDEQDLVGGEDEANENEQEPLEDADAGEEYGEGEPEQEGGETAANPGTVAPPQLPQSQYKPFIPSGNPHMDRARQRLEEYGLGEIADDLHAAIRHEQNQGFAAQTYVGGYLGELQAEDPQYYQRNAPAIHEFLAALPQDFRATREAVWMAWQAAPGMQSVRESGLREAYKAQRAGLGQQQSRAVRPQQQPSSAPRAVTPSPSAGGGGNSAPARQPEAKATKAAGSRASRYLQGLGYDGNEARRLQDKIEV